MRVQESRNVRSNKIEDENENLASGAIRDDKLSGGTVHASPHWQFHTQDHDDSRLVQNSPVKAGLRCDVCYRRSRRGP